MLLNMMLVFLSIVGIILTLLGISKKNEYTKGIGLGIAITTLIISIIDIFSKLG